jgi:hypothetical protein
MARGGVCGGRWVVVVVVKFAVMVYLFASTAMLSAMHSLLRLWAGRSEICCCC